MPLYPSHLISASFEFAPIVKSDTIALTRLTRAIYVGTGGDLVVVGMDGVAVTFKNIPDGTLLNIGIQRVNLTDSSASDIVALY